MDDARRRSDVDPRAPEGHHEVHVYLSEGHLLRTVAGFARDALEGGEFVLLVPTAARREPLLAELGRAGAEALAEGRLLVFDADALARICVAGGAAGVEEVWDGFVRGLESVRSLGHARVAVWGETTHELLKAGRRDLYADLESRWCRLAAREPVRVLCSYRGDLLDPEIYAGDLQIACDHHPQVAVENLAQVQQQVEQAAFEVLGPRLSGMAWALADARAAVRPPAVARLLWLHREMPSTWRRVVSLACPSC